MRAGRERGGGGGQRRGEERVTHSGTSDNGRRVDNLPTKDNLFAPCLTHSLYTPLKK